MASENSKYICSCTDTPSINISIWTLQNQLLDIKHLCFLPTNTDLELISFIIGCPEG
jgi:hypothetical protein